MKERSGNRGKEELKLIEEKAKKDFGEIRPILQATFMIGNGNYVDPLTTPDEVIDLAYTILVREVENREIYQNTFFCKDRIRTLERHRDRAQHIYDEEYAKDYSEEDTIRAYHQLEAFRLAVEPLDGVDLLIAEQEVRNGTFDLSQLPTLVSGEMNFGAPQTDLSDMAPLTDDDFRKLINGK